MKTYLTAKWRQFVGWLAWSAWDYARRREIAKQPWIAGTSTASEDDTPDQRRIKANEARQVLENRHFIDAFNAVDRALDTQTMACDIDAAGGKDKAARIIIAKQLLHAVRREMVRKLEDGYMAEATIVEIEKKRRAALRFVR